MYDKINYMKTLRDVEISKRYMRALAVALALGASIL